jgi:hypothetical protein
MNKAKLIINKRKKKVILREEEEPVEIVRPTDETLKLPIWLNIKIFFSILWNKIKYFFTGKDPYQAAIRANLYIENKENGSTIYKAKIK